MNILPLLEDVLQGHSRARFSRLELMTALDFGQKGGSVTLPYLCSSLAKPSSLLRGPLNHLPLMDEEAKTSWSR
jgi:hypothetical protein